MVARFFKWFWAKQAEEGIFIMCVAGVVILSFAAIIVYLALCAGLIKDERLGGLIVTVATLLGMGGFLQIRKKYSQS